MRRVLGTSVLLCAVVAVISAQAPQWTADPLWPKPLPNHWILGSVTGLATGSDGTTWVAHRGAASMNLRTENALDATPPGAEYCCAAAPPVLAFDSAGTLVASWGGPGEGYDWPQNPGGLAVDADGHVWLTAQGLPAAPAGRGGRGGRGGNTPPPPEDAHILKFTRDGKFVLQIGKAGEPGDATSQVGLRRPAGVAVASDSNEVFVADTGNNRVVVFDATSGAYKRHWVVPVRENSLSCVTLGHGDEVFVCDKVGNRVVVFQRDGTFVRDGAVASSTGGSGAVWDIALSRDADARHIFVANGAEQTVHILQRDTLAEVGRLGAGGRWPGHFYGVGSVDVDSQGNVITGEALQGKRVQKFLVR
jgi:hypothetical protein